MRAGRLTYTMPQAPLSTATPFSGLCSFLGGGVQKGSFRAQRIVIHCPQSQANQIDVVQAGNNGEREYRS